jgi:hypothetical protein
MGGSYERGTPAVVVSVLVERRILSTSLLLKAVGEVPLQGYLAHEKRPIYFA